ncbi:MAG: tetratricopeptide repeat protein, partial [Thermotogaceae bacterium]|nr:tetratricopeptide repeat protein [Thermotogaceae bacterium]
QDASEGKYVYISYSPHELPEVAQRLKEDLEHLGYEVFLGAGQITAGGQWDAAQNEGLQRLKDGGWFIYLMTPSSVRQGQNFCLNEVTWAVHHFTGALLPLMVKPCKPPLSIYHIHYYPIDDCIPIKEKEERYLDHLKEIQAILERRKPIPIPDERSEPERILRPMAFDWKKLTALDCFTGREWALEKAKEWAANPNASRIFRIWGEPGTGRSAIAAWLVREMPEFIQAIHFCDRNDEEKPNINRIICSIACQLAFCLEDYGQILKDKVFKKEKRYSNPMIEPRKLFEELIIDPFTHLKVQRKDLFTQPVTLVIDGPDDDEGLEIKHEMAQLIRDRELQNKTPAWIRWIITSRCELLILLLYKGTPIQVDLYIEENQRADFRAYYEKRLSGLLPEQKRENILETLVNRAGGSFLYCELMCDDIERDPRMLRSPKKFPEGMNGYLNRFFSVRFPQGLDDRTRDVLSLMCAAVEPLEADLIRKITGMKKTEFEKCLRAVDPLVLYEEKTETVCFYHTIVRTWLTWEQGGLQPDIYEIEPEKGHRMLADYGWDYLQKKHDWKEPLDYVIENLGIHLYASSKKPLKYKTIRDRLLELFQKSFSGEEKARLPETVIADLLSYVIAHWSEDYETGFKGIVDRFLKSETQPEAKHALADFLHNRCNYDSKRRDTGWARWMLQRQRSVIEELVEAHPENTEWLWDLGESWSKIGDIEKKWENLDQARDAYEKALAIMLELTAKDPANTDWLHDLGLRWCIVGDIEKGRGNLNLARDACEKFLAIMLELTAKDPDDAVLLENLSVSWNDFGDIEAELLNLDQALKAYEKCLEILLDLTEKDPANTLRQLVLGVVFGKAAGIEAKLGNLTRARENYEKALATTLELIAKDPANTRWQSNLCLDWERMGDLEEQLGNLDRARDAYAKALEIRLDLTAIDPANTDWLQGLYQNWDKIGGIEEARGNLDKALEAFEKSLGITLDLTEKYPTRDVWQLALGASLHRIGGIEEARGNLDQALEAFEKDLAHKLELAKKDPANTDWLRGIDVSWNKIGDIEAKRGNLAQALEAYTKSMETNLVLTKKDPTNTLWLHDLSVSWNKIGDIEEKRGSLPQARDAYKKAQTILRKLTKKDSTNTDWLRDLGVTWSKIGDIDAAQGNRAQARNAYGKDLAILFELTEKDPANTDWLLDLSVSWSKIGDIEEARGNLDQALEAFEKALSILLELTEKDPANTDWLLELSASWVKIGDIEKAQGNLPEAQDAYEKDLAIKLELTEKDPENTDWQRSYGISLSRLGIFHQQQGDTIRAKEYLLRVLELRRSLVDRAPQEIDYNIGLVYALLGLYSVVENEEEKREYWGEASGITKYLAGKGVEHGQLDALKKIFGIE